MTNLTLAEAVKILRKFQQAERPLTDFVSQEISDCVYLLCDHCEREREIFTNVEAVVSDPLACPWCGHNCHIEKYDSGVVYVQCKGGLACMVEPMMLINLPTYNSWSNATRRASEAAKASQAKCPERDTKESQ